MTSIVRIVKPGEVIDQEALDDPNIRIRTVCAPYPDQTTVNGVVMNPYPETAAPAPAVSGTTDEPLED